MNVAGNDRKQSEKQAIRWRGKQRQIFEYITNLDVQSLKVKDIAAEIGLGERQVRRYLTPAFWKEALDYRRERYAKLSFVVDIGLAKKAAKGDAAASKLFYQRFENWKEPKAPMEITAKVKTKNAIITAEMSSREAALLYAQIIKGNNG